MDVDLGWAESHILLSASGKREDRRFLCLQTAMGKPEMLNIQAFLFNGMDAVNNLVIIVICRPKPHLNPPDYVFILDSSPFLSLVLMEEVRGPLQKNFNVVTP